MFAAARAGSFKAQVCASQLTAMAGITEVVLNPERQPRAAAAFASSTGRPAEFMPWLLTLCRALMSNPGIPPGELLLPVWLCARPLAPRPLPHCPACPLPPACRSHRHQHQAAGCGALAA